MLERILKELRHHAPFTLFGAITGVLLILFFKKIPSKIAFDLFYTLHPIHVFLSALVTTSMYKLYKSCKPEQQCSLNIIALILVGYTGSIGISTLSDCLIPYWSEVLLNMPNRHIHIGFIEKWWLVNPLAFLGIAVAYFKPKTKFPHYFHVLLSTWASLFHIEMAMGRSILSPIFYISIFIFLFIAVWIPCCLSDIVYPLLFVKNPCKINVY